MSTDNAHLPDRAARAEKIIAAPEKFKVCEGCDSIVTERVVNCPNCHGYRFDEAPERVVEQGPPLGDEAPAKRDGSGFVLSPRLKLL